MRSGAIASRAAFPRRIGGDLAGTVLAVGDGAAYADGAPIAVGDEVLGRAAGAIAEQVSAAASDLARRPDSLDVAVAGGLHVAGLTAVSVLATVPVGAGDLVLVGGAAGAVGLVAAQLALAAGARVVGTASERNHALLRSVGVEPVGWRTVAALGAIAAGVILGILIGSFRTLRRLLEPLLEFFRAIPPPVMLPLLMIIMGVNWRMQVFVIIFGSLWPVLLNTVEGVRATDEVQRETARSYQLGRADRLRYLTLPAAAPQIMAGVRQSLSIALILMVISELWYTSSGLGFTIVQFQRNFAIPEMWSGILLLGLIGLALALIFRYVERYVLRWYHGLRDVQRAPAAHREHDPAERRDERVHGRRRREADDGGAHSPSVPAASPLPSERSS